MKNLRKPLALLLALMLAFGIGAPAMAEEVGFEAEAAMESPVQAAEAPVAAAAVNWDEFSIINVSQTQIISRGESCTLSVEVNIPDGIDEVTYQWSSTGEILAGATANTLQVRPDDAYYPKDAYHYTGFSCSITAIDNDDGQSKTLSLPRQIEVRIKRTFGEKLYSVTLGPFAEAFSLLPFMFEESRNGAWWGFPIYLLSLPQFILANFLENIMELSWH